MGCRSTLHVVTVIVGIFLAVLLGVALFRGSFGDHSTRKSGPPASTPPGDRNRIKLVWVISDTISCRDAAYTVRRIRSTHGDRLKLTILRSGVSAASVNRILERERLDGTVLPADSAPYEDLFQASLTTSLHVLRGREILASWRITDQRRPSSFQSELEALLPSP